MRSYMNLAVLALAISSFYPALSAPTQYRYGNLLVRFKGRAFLISGIPTRVNSDADDGIHARAGFKKLLPSFFKPKSKSQASPQSSNPTPLTSNPTPLTSNPTPVTSNPTPVTSDPDPNPNPNPNPAPTHYEFGHVPKVMLTYPDGGSVPYEHYDEFDPPPYP
jgi:hypothetical protein